MIRVYHLNLIGSSTLHLLDIISINFLTFYVRRMVCLNCRLSQRTFLQATRANEVPVDVAVLR